MALTKISTGGVKDDAVTAGMIPADAVGQSEIADEAVDEARLQISNAGTNGQFLQKQSGDTGGLTWAAANQYTHPNHSGEVTSSADGAQTIASNVVDEDNLKISNAGTNGQFLQKQSGNTGGLPWAAVTLPPAGNTVDLVADGAIAAGKPVIIKSNGKAAQIQISSTAQDEVVINNASDQSWGSTTNGFALEGNTRKNCMAYNPDSDTTLVISHNESTNKYNLELFSTPSTGTDAQKAAITRHQKTDLSPNAGAMEDKGFFCVCNLSGKRFFVIYEYNNRQKCRVVTVDSDHEGFTLGTENNLIAASSQKHKWFSAVETTTDRVVFMCTSESNSGEFADEHFGLICGDISNSGNTWTKRSSIELDNNNSGVGSKGGRIDYDSTNGVIGVSWSTDNNVTFRALKVASGTGAAFTAGTGTQYASGTYRNTLKYHSNSGSWITFSCTNGGANYVQAHTVNSSTLAITSGTAVYLSSWAGGTRGVDIEVTNDHKIVLGWLRSSDDITTKMYTISGTTLTATSGNATNIMGNISNKQTFGMVYQGHNGVISAFGHYDNSGSDNGIAGGSGLTVTDATNLSSDKRNFIGFAEDAINDTATGTIKLRGNVVGGQSGLTIGTLYEVQDAGTLTANWQSNSVGLRALSATKGQIIENTGI